MRSQQSHVQISILNSDMFNCKLVNSKAHRQSPTVSLPAEGTQGIKRPFHIVLDKERFHWAITWSAVTQPSPSRDRVHYTKELLHHRWSTGRTVDFVELAVQSASLFRLWLSAEFIFTLAFTLRCCAKDIIQHSVSRMRQLTFLLQLIWTSQQWWDDLKCLFSPNYTQNIFSYDNFFYDHYLHVCRWSVKNTLAWTGMEICPVAPLLFQYCLIICYYTVH